VTVLCLLMMVSLALAGRWSKGQSREQADEYNGADAEESYERNVMKRDWCARWGDNCVPDAKVKFAKCCAGMRCDCGSGLLGGGKCQCKKESVFGR